MYTHTYVCRTYDFLLCFLVISLYTSQYYYRKIYADFPFYLLPSLLMKKISLFVFLLFTVLLAGCGKPNQQIVTTNSVPSQKLPICVPEKLINGPILNMDSLVKNCTEKKVKGDSVMNDI